MATEPENLPPNVRSEEDVEELDEVFSKYREKRLEELKSQQAARDSMRHLGHGKYSEMPSEKDFMQLVTQSKKVICHFYLKDFRRCTIVDAHLEALAQKHFDVRIVKLSVEKAPFLVEKLAVRTLPCIICFVDAQAVDRVVGFADLGNVDNFPASRLEARLAQHGVLKLTGSTKAAAGGSAKKSIVAGTALDDQEFD